MITIYTEATLNYMLREGLEHIVQEIVSKGVPKELNSDVRYIIVYDEI